MAKTTLDYIPLRMKFDWEALEKKMKAAGGLSHCLRQAGVPNNAWYNARNADEDVPLRSPIQKLFAHFNMTATEARKFIVVKPTKER
jgi:hypothetical protein